MKKILVILALVLPMMASAQKYGHVNTAELFQLMPELKDVTARLDSLNKQYEARQHAGGISEESSGI